MSPNQNCSGQLVRKAKPRNDKSFRTIEQLGTRDELAHVVGVSDDPRVIRLVSLLLSPRTEIKRRSLAKLADMCDLSYAELLRTISQSNVSAGLLRMSQHVPNVMESVAVNACNREVPCELCKGTGEVIDRRFAKKGQPANSRQCHNCGGSGKVTERGNVDAQKMVFESIGLTNRKSPLFAINLKDRPGELPSTESEMGSISRILDVQREP